MARASTKQNRSKRLEARFDPDVFRALGDETRLALLSRLAVASKPLTVTEAAECCGVHLSGVSRHLAALRAAGVIHAEKAGREVRYTLDCQAFAAELRALAEALEACQPDCCKGSES